MYLVLGKPECSYCDDAIDLLAESGEEYIYFDVTDTKNARLKEILTVELGLSKVPQIFELVYGYSDLCEKLENEGKL
jgi:glutaredoxin